MFRFEEDDIKKYREMTPKWGQVGCVTYTRTYSRDIEDNKRESWLDTCIRVIEGNMNLIPNDPTATKEWALKALDYAFHMGAIPSGRNLWMMGTEYQQQRGGDSLNNCWWTVCKPHVYGSMEMFEDTYKYFSNEVDSMPSFSFVFTFDRAMLGGGVGFLNNDECVNSFPVIKSKVNIISKLNPNHPDWQRICSSEEWETVKDTFTDSIPQDAVIIPVEDTRQGWCVALREVIDSHWFAREDEVTVVFDFSEVRGYGEPIKGFGGTASGPLPLIYSLHEINNILNNHAGNHITSLDILDMQTLIGRCVVSGNVRRTALLALGEGTDEDYINAKNYNLVESLIDTSYGDYGWYTNSYGRKTQKLKPYDEIVKLHGEEKARELINMFLRQDTNRWASNNSVLTMELTKDFHFIATGMSVNGEPGIVNQDLIQNYGRIIDGYQKGIDGKATGVNPCFRGDMRLLTTEGYKTFEELDGKEVEILNKEGKVSSSKVWCSGEKETVKITFRGGKEIYCTPDHKFMLNDGKTACEARNLNGKRVMPYLRQPDEIDDYCELLGVAHAYGTLHESYDIVLVKRQALKTRELTEYFELTPNLFEQGMTALPISREEFISIWGEDDNIFTRKVPKEFYEWSKVQKASFIRGYVSSSGALLSINNGIVRIRFVSEQVALNMKEVLKSEFNIDTTLFPYRMKKFYQVKGKSNGTVPIQYVLEIATRDNKQKFYNEIGFIQPERNAKLKDFLVWGAPVVGSVRPSEPCKVYDFTEPKTHWGVVEGLIAHNCGEVTLEDGEPCNLFEVVPYKCAINNQDIYDALEIATIYAYRITFAKYSWNITQEVINRNRRIGVSLTGMQDYFLHKYGHYGLKEFEDGDMTKPIFYPEIVKELCDWYEHVKATNKFHAGLLGTAPSIKVTTCKPSGTIAKLPGVSSGIHWHYAGYMIQRIRFHESDSLLKVLEFCHYPIERDMKAPNTLVVEFPIKAPNAEHPNFKCTEDVSLEEQFANQYLFAYAWADNAVSATLTFQAEEKNKIEPLLMAYNNRIKSTSLLPYYGHGIVQAPWEPISREEYERRVSDIVPVEEVLSNFTINTIVDLMESDCSSGGCPVK